MEDSWGQEWTYSQRRTLEFTCNSAYLLAVVQVTDALVLSHLGQPFTCRSSGRVFEEEIRPEEADNWKPGWSRGRWRNASITGIG